MLLIFAPVPAYFFRRRYFFIERALASCMSFRFAPASCTGFFEDATCWEAS